MAMLPRLRSLWRNLVHRSQADAELDEELHSYVELVAGERRAAGLGADDARRAARLDVGGLQQVTEAVRDARGGASIETTWQDVRFGARLLRRSPSFALAAIVSLALAIGANSAVFGLLNALRLRSLPVNDAHELATIRLEGPRCCRHTSRNRQVSVPLWREIVQRQQAFSGLFAFSDTRFNLAPDGEVRYVEGLFVSGEFFPVLGVRAAIGRTLTPEDDRPGCADAAAMISHSLWQTEFGGRDDVLMQSLQVGSTRHPIAGVMPADFFGVEVGRRVHVMMPICASGFGRADHWWLAIMGRLEPGWTIEQANAHLETLGPALLGAATPPNYGAEQARQFLSLRFSVHPASNGVSPLRTQYEDPLWLLLAIAGLVLVTACANLASLSLVRATAREAELTLRFALGASRLRVVRQLLVEGALIAVAGSAAGLVLARIAQDAVLVVLSTRTDPIVLEGGLDWRVLAFTAVVALLATLAFAAAAQFAASPMRHGAFQLGPGARMTARRGRLAARELLLGIQVAMSVVLVSAAMVFVFTVQSLSTLDAGFAREDVLVANVFLNDREYPPQSRAAAQQALTARLAAIPGITAVAHATTPPMSGSSWDTVVRIPSPQGERKGETNRNQVSAGYFTVLRTSILAGRDFNALDTPASPKVAIVNQTFARRFFGTEQPLGRRFLDGEQEFEIVGVVRDTKQYSLREPFRPIAYTAASQVPSPPTTIRFVLRSQLASTAAIESVRRTLAEFSPSAAVRFATMTTMADESMLRERLLATLSGFFGLIAMALAAVGIYGVVSYTAASRQREIGIRVALGARARHVVREVVGRVAVIVAVGLVAGGVLMFSTSAALATFVYGISPRDPAVIARILLVVLVPALAAAAIPTRRALRSDPVVALKQE